jgi:hypothetical protein
MSRYDSRPVPSDPFRLLPKTRAGFVEPLDCLPVSKLPGRSAMGLGDQVGWLPSSRDEIERRGDSLFPQ